MSLQHILVDGTIPGVYIVRKLMKRLQRKYLDWPNISLGTVSDAVRPRM